MDVQMVLSVFGSFCEMKLSVLEIVYLCWYKKCNL